MTSFYTYHIILFPLVCFQLSFESKLIQFCANSQYVRAATSTTIDRIVRFEQEIDHDNVVITLPGGIIHVYSYQFGHKGLSKLPVPDLEDFRFVPDP